MTRDIKVYLEDIVDAITKIEEYTQGLDMEQFRKDRQKAPDVPWKQMVGMRDKLIHEYFGVRLSTMWDAIKNQLPSVKPALESLLKQT